MNTHPLLWTLRSIARLERKGDLRAPRLTEPGFKKWERMRRKLDFVDLIALLHEDLADAFPYPFDLRRWTSDPLSGLDDESARGLIDQALAEDSATAQSFLRQAARALELPPSGNIAQLPKVQPHQSALELPGAGGRIAAQQAIEHGVAVSDRFTFITDTDADRLCIGLALVEIRANEPRVWTLQEARDQLAKGERFDQVFGVSEHPPAASFAKQAGLEVRWT
jgi:hypothetical protein